jgi:hypothetical protein
MTGPARLGVVDNDHRCSSWLPKSSGRWRNEQSAALFGRGRLRCCSGGAALASAGFGSLVLLVGLFPVGGG